MVGTQPFNEKNHTLSVYYKFLFRDSPTRERMPDVTKLMMEKLLKIDKQELPFIREDRMCVIKWYFSREYRVYNGERGGCENENIVRLNVQ